MGTFKNIPLLLILMIGCNAQIYYIKPNDCEGECCLLPYPNCHNLSDYAQLINSEIRGQPTFMLGPGQYYLDKDFIVNGSISSFTLIGNHTEAVTITCRQNSSILFTDQAEVNIQNVGFVSCGGKSLPGVVLIDIHTIQLTNISISRAKTGALNITRSSSVWLTNFSLWNNKNSQATIVFIQSDELRLFGQTSISNNSIGVLDPTCMYGGLERNAVVFWIVGSTLLGESVSFTDNVGPLALMAVIDSNISVSNGNWLFERNCACLRGSLLLNNTTVEFNGVMTFLDNKVIAEANRSTAGLYMTSSTLMFSDELVFVRNQGYVTSMQITNSSTLSSKGGSINLINNTNGYRSVTMKENSKLTIINGSFMGCNNLISEDFILAQNSEIMIEGRVYISGIPNVPITVSISVLNLFGQIEFKHNAGIIYAGQSMIVINGNSTFMHNDIEDGLKHGALTLVQSTLTLAGTYTFEKNLYSDDDGGAIYAIIGSTVSFGGRGQFKTNSANYGGALYFDQRSRIELKKGVEILFDNNTANRGGAIFIGTSIEHTQCQSDPNTCLFHLENKDASASLVFHRNRAFPGGSIIHVNFDEISDSDVKFPALDDLNRTVVLSGSNSDPTFDSDSYRFCFCEDDSRDGCSRNNKSLKLSVAKGQIFSVKVRTLKFYGNHMSELVRSSLISSLLPVNTDSSFDTFLHGKEQRASAENCMRLNFFIKSHASEEVIIMNAGESSVDNEKILLVNTILNEQCPAGFPLDEENYTCACDKNIKQYLQSCKIEDEYFQKKIEYKTYWMAASKNSSVLDWYPDCPTGFCKTYEKFTFINDGICANNRSGLLCGNCINGTSLLIGGEKCDICPDNSHIALVLVFLALGIALVAVIFLTQTTVAAGTINGLILYANILNSNHGVFFPEAFFPGYVVFISWLNLDFGIETCFYNGMTQTYYSGLQFLFPVYIWLLSGVIIALCYFSAKISKFFGKSDPVAVLATLILLSYNSLAQNIIRIFYFATLNYPGNTTEQVWRYNGNVVYATGGHTILLVIGILFAVLGFLPFTFTLLLAPFLQKSDRISKILQRLRLQPFIHVYLVPLKPAHRYWVGLTLLVRGFLLFFISNLGDNNRTLLIITTTCFVGISMFKITGGIYDKSWLDILEISFLANLGILAASIAYISNPAINGRREIATYISVTLALLTFLGIIALHIFWRFKKVQTKLQCKMKSLIKLDKPVIELQSSVSGDSVGSATQSVLELTANHTELREPLLDS